MPSAATAGRNTDSAKSAGTTSSRGRSTAISSANACRPVSPEYSADRNSPVDRSMRATPTA